jgi:hypothetical protein
MTRNYHPDTALRMSIERQVIKRLVQSALAAGYAISVNDGEEITERRCTDVGRIMAAVMTTDEDYLHIHAAGQTHRFGWVRLIYGNDGWDVICDYTTNLEPLMAPVTAVADRLEARFG